MHQVRHILQLKGDYIWTISPDDTVFEALRLMATKGVGALVVTKDEKMVGIISERERSYFPRHSGEGDHDFAGFHHPSRPNHRGMHGIDDRQTRAPPPRY